MLVLSWLFRDILYPSWTALSFQEIKTVFLRPDCLGLFYLSMNNINISSKIPLPHYITVYNVN